MKTQNKLIKALALAALVVALLSPPFTGQASHNQIECESKSKHVKAVTAPDFHDTTTVFNFPADGSGHFNPAPLLSTTVNVGGRGPSCLVAHFSAMARPIDNGVVFQVRVDGVPMQGHLSGLANTTTPAVIFQTTSLDQFANVRQFMVAYNFFAEVRPGSHTVEVLFAGCCSGDPPPGALAAQVGSPVLTLEYVGE